MIIDCISDLHGYYPELEGGDLLIVAGDLTAHDEYDEYEEFFTWLDKQEYNKKLFILGNHDNLAMSQFDWYDAEYLYDSGIEFEGLKIWGSPWTKTFPGTNQYCKSYTCDTEEELAKKWALIPDDIDILVTHSPPNGILDYLGKKHKICESLNELCAGSSSLREHVMSRIKPKLHVFGHIHEWGGKMVDCVTTKFINASIVNERYEHVNKPIRIEL